MCIFWASITTWRDFFGYLRCVGLLRGTLDLLQDHDIGTVLAPQRDHRVTPSYQSNTKASHVPEIPSTIPGHSQCAKGRLLEVPGDRTAVAAFSCTVWWSTLWQFYLGEQSHEPPFKQSPTGRREESLCKRSQHEL